MDIVANRTRLEAWLVLLRAPGLGPATLRELLAAAGDAPRALAAARRGTHERTREADCRAWLRAPDPALIEADFAWLAQPGHALLACDEADFPTLLDDAAPPPAALFVAGAAEALWQPQLAIVGSRNASQAGQANAAAFARALAASGFAITSGLAEGIDGAAHAATLDAGATTIAVLGTGADVVYPARHDDLAACILAGGGALVSEFPLGTPPHPTHFPRRNRIIASLALGTLVVEAGLRSGSLLTARQAAEAGREVFAIPGSIHNPLARGCHQLIRSGAKLVETAEEIVAELAPLARRLGASLRERLQAPAGGAADPPRRTMAAHADDPDYARLYAALDHEPLGIDVLAGRSGLPVAALSSMLLMLELEGEVVAERGGYARRAGSGA
ncbi:DNA-processing protein DprA [Dokdonella fugitiva]|jgi:DNA processing protein|uniref:DNA processing protein n=1 Tax=Dokdonella fugitiva TaxID=328517 RepID=A0A4R2IF45_9GAMM|nr:DNA-processing protein DprA [Dokdonella fugitiva]MBA8882691.1 DNA processing protein [Dokdonella fugitiva]TCO43333.1 DNA processing protein [Dokdonella fugitiva]